MASTSGTKQPGAVDGVPVPSSLASIAPILRVADEIQKENPRVAFLCRKYAFERANELDHSSTGRGVREFKTKMSRRLGKEEVDTESRFSNAHLIQWYYQVFYETNIGEGQHRREPKAMPKILQMATILHEVLKTVVDDPMKVDSKTERYAADVEKKKELYEPYNILPLYAAGFKQKIMDLPEIAAAFHSLQKNVDKLPIPSYSSATATERVKSIRDILDWLSAIFGFQKGNVANQREHLILLLANKQIRNEGIDSVQQLMDEIFKNYTSWCNYLRCELNLKFPDPQRCDRQQLKLIYIGLYLLIWGEASNVRFMPECLCYIFHNMADEVHKIVNGDPYQPKACGEESFLQDVITPIYQVLLKEVGRDKEAKKSLSVWRNYDDLNEYFWSDKCIKPRWSTLSIADLFGHSDEIQPANERAHQAAAGKREPKANFVEVRTFWHLYRSFARMWILFILAFQLMVIVAWSQPSGSLAVLFDADVFRSVLSIFITWAFLNLLQATMEIILTWNAWKNLKFSQIIRYLLKFAVAAMWAVVLPIGYASFAPNPTGLVKFFSGWGGDWRNQSFYTYAVAIFLVPNILAAVLFLAPPLKRRMERSNRRIFNLLRWWAQPKLYVGRGMHEGMFSVLKYTLFWIALLISKFAFSYYVEILPLVAPTKLIREISINNYQWHEFFPNGTNNIGAVIAIWGPIVLVYIMDTQIWYAIFSALFGAIHGAFSHLGEIRTLGMLRTKFHTVPNAFHKYLVPSANKDTKSEDQDESQAVNLANFSRVWNEFINSMRMEDLLSNRDREMLLVPYPSNDVSVVQWPLFLLASKIPIALDLARGKDDDELLERIKSDYYMDSAVTECYKTLRHIISCLLLDENDKKILERICKKIDQSIVQRTIFKQFKMSELPQLSEQLEKFLKLSLAVLDEDSKLEITNNLQCIFYIITKDIMVGGSEILQNANLGQGSRQMHPFVYLDFEAMQNKSWKEEVVRLHLLLTVKESAISVPQNLEARRRITFFVNSLFMKMPRAPRVQDMLSFSVLTPYYKEDVLYSEDELNMPNEDGISTLFYLQKIYPDEWTNFQERIKSNREKEKELTRQWVSYRGQTLSRTVRGMMYYRRALELQCFLESLGDRGDTKALADHAQALVDLKFTYVVSCQLYGNPRNSDDLREKSNNIRNLMSAYPSLRVAYIDEREELVNRQSQKFYFSVLVKGGDNLDHEEIYRIKLPGNPIDIGEGKPENQNHAIIFTRGEALQTIDMNQDNYFEEAFKMRNVLNEFLQDRHGKHKPSILGLREYVFTGSVSSLAWFMSNQETSFVTIGQRILANPLRVRFHYGHPDIFDRIFHITRGGISKASKVINLSEDIFAGFNSTLRGGFVTHHEYIQVGKGRDVGMNQISIFEAKVASGNGEQTLSREVYRLGSRFDFYRMLSFYFTTVGFYFSSMVTVLTVFVFLYGRLYMVMSGVEREILENTSIQQTQALEEALAAQSVFQLGLLLVLPMVIEIGLEKGFPTAIGHFIIMQLELASVFFTFQLGSKAHYYGRTILHGGSKYQSTGRGFVVFHAKFAENYRMYSRSHFVKGLELFILLIVYEVYGISYRSSKLYWFITFSVWFLVASWLFAPSVFNPSGFDWQKTVDDWTDWKRWMENRGGIGNPAQKSWEIWWDEEQGHLKHTTFRGRVLEIILAFRFFVYQYGIVYQLDIAHHIKSLLVYGLSWFVMVSVLVVLKVLSMGRQKYATDFQLMFRILKVLLFLSFTSVMTILFVVCGLTVSDLFAAILAFTPTGWALLLIGQACRPLFERAKLWDLIKELAEVYEYIMALVIFTPIAILSWFPFISEFQTRLLFNTAFSRGLQISKILAGKKEKTA